MRLLIKFLAPGALVSSRNYRFKYPFAKNLVLWLFVVGFLSMFSLKSKAQVSDFELHQTFVGTGFDLLVSVAVDDSGNVYTLGAFETSIDVDPGPGVQTLVSGGCIDAFVAKFNSLGALLWVKHFSSVSCIQPNEIAVNSTGVYLTGQFDGTVDFDPGTGTNLISSQGNLDVFLVKLTIEGGFIWAGSYGGVSEDHGNGLALGVNSVYVTGSFIGLADFQDFGAFNALDSRNSVSDAFLFEISQNGNLVWAQSFGSNGEDEGYSVAIDDSGYVYTVGDFEGFIDFFDGPSVDSATALSVSGPQDAYVTKHNSSDSLIWTRKIGGSSFDLGYGIAVDHFGDIYVSGGFWGTVDFDHGPGVAIATSNGNYDIYIMKLDTQGNYKWVVTSGGVGQEVGQRIRADNLGNVYTCGYFDSDISFGAFSQSTKGVQDMYLVKCSDQGTPLWTVTLGGTQFDYAYGVSANTRGDVVVVGSYGGIASVNPALFSPITAQGAIDGFLIKFGGCVTLNTSDSVLACHSYTSPSGRYIWSVTGLYQDTLLSTKGCDSIVSISLTIVPNFSTVSNASICDGDSIMLSGNYQNMAGVYIDTTQSISGCDSIHTVTLTVKPNVTVNMKDSICPGDSALVGGGWQTTAGTYTDIYVASNNCDSTVITQLSLRTDSGCVADTTAKECITVVSDNTWMKSTVNDPSNFSGFWAGATVLPTQGTFTNPVTIGQPYGWPSIGQIENSEVFSTGSGITYFRKEFALTNTTGLDVRILSTVDDQADIYLNGHRVALITQFGRPNFKFPAHDIKFFNGTFSNGFMGGDAFDVVTLANLDTVLQVGNNELIVSVRNLGKPSDKGGLSFRMDINCEDTSITKKSAVLAAGVEVGIVTFPNPVSENLNIQSELSINSVRLFDLTGKLVLSEFYYSEKAVEVNLKNLHQGVYILEVEELGGFVTTVKVVKQ